MTEIEKRLHANSKLKSSEHSIPVLDLIFMRCARTNSSLAYGTALAARSVPNPVELQRI
jgi:hypothetical protein